MTNPATCGIWARVSADEQETGNQLAELRQWARAAAWPSPPNTSSTTGPRAGNGPHRPSACHDSDCLRPPSRWYREGREDGYNDGYAAGARSAASR